MQDYTKVYRYMTAQRGRFLKCFFFLQFSYYNIHNESIIRHSEIQKHVFCKNGINIRIQDKT